VVSQEPTPKMFRSANKTGKRLTKSDLVRVQKKISQYARQSAIDLKHNDGPATIDRDTEHKVVFDWFMQSASEMISAMNTRLQKTFVKQVTDQVQANCRLEQEAQDMAKVTDEVR